MPRNISKDWSTDNMKKKGFNGYVHDFSVDYDATDVDDIVDVHKYLMKKYNIAQMKIFGFVKKSVFCMINSFIKFHKCTFFECNSIELYFNEQSRV